MDYLKHSSIGSSSEGVAADKFGVLEFKKTRSFPTLQDRRLPSAIILAV